MRPVATLSLLALLFAAPVAAQINPVDMRSGCLTWNNVTGLISSSLFVVPSGSRFVLTDVTVSRVPYGGPFSAGGGPAIRLTINTGGTTPVPRWISTDRIESTDAPLQLHWATGIVFEPNQSVEAAASVQSGTAPTITVCWSGYLVSATTTSVNDGPPASGDLALQARPNPALEGTELSFRLDRAQPVVVGVYAVDGRRIRTLRRGTLGAGEHHVTWDGRDDSGRLTASGVYFAGVETADRRETRRISMLR
jgi:FlgD Ig-like domain